MQGYVIEIDCCFCMPMCVFVGDCHELFYSSEYGDLSLFFNLSPDM